MFHKLPPELTEEIYSHLLMSKDTDESRQTSRRVVFRTRHLYTHKPHNSRSMSEADVDFRIFRTCKQIYNVVQYFYLASNQIELCIDRKFFWSFNGDTSVGNHLGCRKLDFMALRSHSIDLKLSIHICLRQE